MGKLLFSFFFFYPSCQGMPINSCYFWVAVRSRSVWICLLHLLTERKMFGRMRSLNHDVIWRRCQLYRKIVLGICRRTQESVWRLVRFESLQPRALTGRHWPKDLADTPLFAAISWVRAGRGKRCQRSDVIQGSSAHQAAAFTNYATGMVRIDWNSKNSRKKWNIKCAE